MARCAGATPPTSPGGLMTEVIDRLAMAVNAHDLDAVAGLIHRDYRSDQPAHPGRAFAGRAQMLANWGAMLAGIPTSTPKSAGRYRTVIRPGANGAGRVRAPMGRPLRCAG
jgi:SnoaL-like domain